MSSQLHTSSDNCSLWPLSHMHSQLLQVNCVHAQGTVILRFSTNEGRLPVTRLVQLHLHKFSELHSAQLSVFAGGEEVVEGEFLSDCSALT